MGKEDGAIFSRCRHPIDIHTQPEQIRELWLLGQHYLVGQDGSGRAISTDTLSQAQLRGAQLLTETAIIHPDPWELILGMATRFTKYGCFDELFGVGHKITENAYALPSHEQLTAEKLGGLVQNQAIVLIDLAQRGKPVLIPYGKPRYPPLVANITQDTEFQELDKYLKMARKYFR